MVIASFVVWVLIDFLKAHQLMVIASPVLGAIEPPPKAAGAQYDASSAKQAAEITIVASERFLRGMRGIHMTLCSLAWLLSPWWFAAASIGMCASQLHTAFSSAARSLIIGDTVGMAAATAKHAFNTEVREGYSQRQRLLGRSDSVMNLSAYVRHDVSPSSASGSASSSASPQGSGPRVGSGPAVGSPPATGTYNGASNAEVASSAGHGAERRRGGSVVSFGPPSGGGAEPTRTAPRQAGAHSIPAPAVLPQPRQPNEMAA